MATELPDEHEGVQLVKSSRSPTGYLGVRENGGRFHARDPDGSHIGVFATAVLAAAAYARYVGLSHEVCNPLW